MRRRADDVLDMQHHAVIFGHCPVIYAVVAAKWLLTTREIVANGIYQEGGIQGRRTVLMT